MYNTGPAKPPKRPVVTSLAGALKEVNQWLAENHFNTLRDGDGLAWQLNVGVERVPDPADAKGTGLLWQIRLKLTTSVSAEELVRTGTLDATKDERLIALLADGRVDLSMKPLVYTLNKEEEARLTVAEVVPKLKASFLRNSLGDVKRALVGRFIDEQGRFGADRD